MTASDGIILALAFALGGVLRDAVMAVIVWVVTKLRLRKITRSAASLDEVFERFKVQHVDQASEPSNPS